jgi:hypothetical protein
LDDTNVTNFIEELFTLSGKRKSLTVHVEHCGVGGVIGITLEEREVDAKK